MGFRVQKRSSSSLPLYLVFLLAIIFFSVISAFEYPNGKQPSRARLRRIEKYLAKINKPAVLSIDSPDGDIIDCVDKWKQPAFDHPLLKNHTLQMAPDIEKRKEEVEFSKRVPLQVWHLNGTGCPKDTVPIRRTTVKDVLMAKSLRDFIRKRPNSGPPHSNMTISRKVNNPEDHEYAVARAVVTEPLFGMGATINIWNPSVRGPHEFSLAQMWIVHRSADPNQLNTLEAGWQVYPDDNDGERGTKLFVYWTSDNYRHTGCYNLRCPGYVQSDDFLIPGATMLTPYSTINGIQYDNEFEISHSFLGGNWWLKIKAEGQTRTVGYFQANTVPSMSDGANAADWGGEILNSRRRLRGERHTMTKMGSGRFAEAGYGQAAFFGNIFVSTGAADHISPQTTTFASHPHCYTVTTPTWDTSPMGLHFFYGGPGGAAPNCR